MLLFAVVVLKLKILTYYVGLRRCGFEVGNLAVFFVGAWWCGLMLKILAFYVRIWCFCLELKILTFYVGVWRCCFEVEKMDGLCWELAVLFEVAV